MSNFLHCDNCNQLIQRAHLDNGKHYCVQCLSHQWQVTDESDALLLLENPIDVTEVELVNEALVVLR